jgi:hypothetical protein
MAENSMLEVVVEVDADKANASSKSINVGLSNYRGRHPMLPEARPGGLSYWSR